MRTSGLTRTSTVLISSRERPFALVSLLSWMAASIVGCMTMPHGYGLNVFFSISQIWPSWSKSAVAFCFNACNKCRDEIVASYRSVRLGDCQKRTCDGTGRMNDRLEMCVVIIVDMTCNAVYKCGSFSVSKSEGDRSVRAQDGRRWGS